MAKHNWRDIIASANRTKGTRSTLDELKAQLAQVKKQRAGVRGLTKSVKSLTRSTVQGRSKRVLGARVNRHKARSGYHNMVQDALRTGRISKSGAKGLLRASGWKSRRRDSRGRFA